MALIIGRGRNWRGSCGGGSPRRTGSQEHWGPASVQGNVTFSSSLDLRYMGGSGSILQGPGAGIAWGVAKSKGPVKQ